MGSLSYSGPSPFYKELAELPSVTHAQFIATSTAPVVRVSYSIRDHELNAKRLVSKTFFLKSPDPATNSPVISTSINHDSAEISALLYAPSGTRHAILREVSDGSGGKTRYVEVLSGIRMEASLNVTKVHGQFHKDDCFKSFSFTPSETALVYAAEANPETAENPEDDPYPKFRFTPHFGERSSTIKRPTLFVFRWRSPPEDGNNIISPPFVTALSLDQPPIIPVVFGQAVFATETRIYATGYERTADGKVLGTIGCFNRPTGIWEIALPGLGATTTTVCKAVKSDTPERSPRSPRVLFDANGAPKSLFWISNPLGGAHASTVSLHVRDLKDAAGDRVLVDAVFDPSPEEFPGLYLDYKLADSPFLKLGDKTYILVQSLWRSRPTLILIDVETGAVVDLAPVKDGQPLYSWSLFGTDGARSVICSRSTPTSPPEIILLTLTDDGTLEKSWVLDKPTLSSKLQDALDQLDARVIPIPGRYPVETIVIRSKTSEQESNPLPFCLTIPHGGPHASSVTSFSSGALAYALEGYTVSMPNYTGSTGFGEKYIQKLVGQCGTLDVGDCIATVEELSKLGLSVPERQIVQGGSHGGFLAAHLVGQYPDVFSAAVVRNPVVSAGEFCTSDITDWSFYEFGLSFGPSTHVTPGDFSALYARSPIAHVDHVKAPVLILVGEDDLRVPPSQGKGFYHVLKGKGRVVDLLVFPKESHPIDGVEAARVSFEAGRDWFRNFTQEK